jgi:hypothetical protein
MRLCHVAGFTVAVGAGLMADGCSGGGGSAPGPSVGTPPPPIVVTGTFPAAAATAAGGGTPWAITGVRTTLSGSGADAYGSPYDTLQVAVTFAQDVSTALPSPGANLTRPGQLGITVGLETRGTGGIGDCTGAPIFDFASDPGIDPARLQDGSYNILSGAQGVPLQSGIAGGNPLDEAVTVVSGHVIVQTFRLLAIDGLASGVPDVRVGVGSFNGASTEPTDCVPANGTIAAGGAQ